MSYYEPSSLYGLEASLGERSRWDSGVHSEYSELWSLAGPCQDCKITIPELKQKLEMVKQEKVYIEAQKGFLHAQLDNSLTMTSSLEAEITGLRCELRDRDAENADLRSRLTRLENEVSLKPEVPPPPPPPPPPKSLFSHIKNNIKIRKSKRAASVPNINSSSATGSSPMKLNNDTLDAIKNRRYQLRPVRRPSVQKKRRLSESAWDVRDVGMGDIAQILSRRISMGYSTIEEDTVSVKSFNSISPFVTVSSVMEREGTVVCLLCRGMISFKAGDKARFESHLQHEHEAYFGLDVLLAVSFIREEERRALVRSVAPGYVDRVERTDLREALDKLRTRARDVSRDASDVSSDFSIEDNDKIYGIPEPILKCEKCSRTFINRISLRRHETQHIEQNYSCNACGERFSFLEDLKIHRLSHRDDADMYVYKEEDSTKVDTTNTGDSTRSNDSAVTGQAGYVRCKLCLRVLRRDNYLAHKVMHKEEKKTSCLVCDSKFRSHEHLKRHVQKAHRNISNATLRSSKIEKLGETHYLPMK